jgi:hypothetical protein
VIRSGGQGNGTPQISPLRSFGAPVEMTKGRLALPATVVAEQDPLFIALGGPLAHDSSSRDDKGERGCGPEQRPGEWETADLSTTLLRSSGRDDKGEVGASSNSSC